MSRNLGLSLAIAMLATFGINACEALSGGGGLGEECGSDSDCSSSICISVGNRSYCSEECTDTCSSAGFECRPSGAVNYCIDTGGGSPDAGTGGGGGLFGNGGNDGGGQGGDGGGQAGGGGGGGGGGDGGGQAGGDGGDGGVGGDDGGIGGQDGGIGGQDGGVGGQDGGGGGLDCAGLNECLGRCGEGDQACGDACFGNATAEGQRLYEAAGACIQANGGDQAACQAEIQACLGAGPPPPPPGDLDCGGIFDCANNCPANDQNCVQGCLAAGTAAAQEEALTLSQCAQDAEAAGQDVQQACAELIDACFGPPAPPGDNSCNQVIDCILACQDDPCAQACYEAGDQQARDLFMAFNDCAGESQCAQIEGCCPAEQDACRADQ